jgi:hypothetical protein
MISLITNRSIRQSLVFLYEPTVIELHTDVTSDYTFLNPFTVLTSTSGQTGRRLWTELWGRSFSRSQATKNQIQASGCRQ